VPFINFAKQNQYIFTTEGIIEDDSEKINYYLT